MTPDQVIDQLVARRLELGWSLREVGERMGISRASAAALLCAYENRRHHNGPGAKMLARWACALGYDLVLELRERP